MTATFVRFHVNIQALLRHVHLQDFFILLDLDPVEVDPKDPLFPSQGDAVELQCKTESSDEYTLQWKKASQKTSILSQCTSDALFYLGRFL